MADTTKKIGSAALAQRVIDLYAKNVGGFDVDRCVALKGGLDVVKCEALAFVLKRGAEGEVTDGERDNLAEMGLAKEFIDGIAGEDGKRALMARVKWLAASCPAVKAGKKRDDKDRISIINELGIIGEDAALAVPVLVPIMRNEAKLTSDPAAEALGGIGPAAKDAVYALINELELRRYKGWNAIPVIEALRKIGEAAKPALPELFNATEYSSYPKINEKKDAIEAIKGIGAPAVAWLASELKSEDGGRRCRAAETLGQIGKPAHHALPFLEEMRAKDSEEVCRKFAAEAVDKISKDVK